MTKPTVTKERLEKIASWPEVYGNGANIMIPALEAKQMAEALLAVMEVQSVTTEVITEIMRQEWDEWCADTGNFPDDFEWRSGRGIMSYAPSRWSHRIAERIVRLTTPPAPAVPDEIDRFVDQVCGDKPVDHQQ